MTLPREDAQFGLESEFYNLRKQTDLRFESIYFKSLKKGLKAKLPLPKNAQENTDWAAFLERNVWNLFVSRFKVLLDVSDSIKGSAKGQWVQSDGSSVTYTNWGWEGSDDFTYISQGKWYTTYGWGNQQVICVKELSSKHEMI